MNIQFLNKKLNDLDKNGFCIIKNVFNEKITNTLKNEILKKQKKFYKIQKKNGLGTSAVNTLHHIPLLCKSSLKLLDPNPLDKIVTKYLEGKYILNIMGAVITSPRKEKVSTQKIHRDIRSFTENLKISVGVIALLDDAPKERGATMLYPGSHKLKTKPTSKTFKKKAIPAEANKGDVIIFDINTWHSSGINLTSNIRVAATYIFSRPFYKQALDYTYAFTQSKKKLSKNLKQLLGFNAKIPKNLNEWYAKPKNRFYKSDQG